MAFQSKFERCSRFSVTLLALLSLSLGALFPGIAAAQTASERAADAASVLDFRELGPAIMGGRVADLAVVESDPRIFYVGLGAGGVWKTTNDGMTWDPVFDDQPTASIGAVSVAPSNPNVVWVGTGEPANRQSSPWGVGVFKSTDAGGTWTHVGLEDTRHISRIRIDPRDPDVVYVGAVGHLWGSNEERGLFKTTDGGETWENVLHIDEHTGIIDLVMDHNDPNTLFAATYQRQRTGFGFAAGGGGSGIWRTTDGGDNWTRLEQGLPEGELGRVGLDVYRRDGNLVYAIVEAREGQGVYRSTDRGETWEMMSDRNPRPMYFSLIRIDPNNPERIYIAGVQASASDDGGRTWWPGNATDQIHSDHHALWINPNDSNHLIDGNDGGLAFSRDGSVTWRSIRNMAIGQFYEIDVDMSDPYNVCGGLQDNGNWCAPHRTQATWGVRNREWTHMWFGDGFHNHSDPMDPNIMFSESQGGNMARIDVATREGQSIRPVPRPTGDEAEDDEPRRYRFNWDSPFAISRHDRATIYLGGNHLFRSSDRGTTWEEASPDLTKAIDRDTLEIMGRIVTDETLSDNDGISNYGNITAFAESKHSPDALYVGTDDGNLQVTLDGGATWTNVIDQVPGVPPRTYVSRLETSSAVDGRVYVTFDGHRNDDYAPHAYVSEDHGASWRRITAGLPDGWSVNVIREHPGNPNLLFLGNEIGVYLSIDRGESWGRMRNNLPTVAVDDIAIHPRENDLVVGTHGRSIWILDDITALEEMAADVFASDFRLFGARRGTMWSMGMDWPFQPATFIAPNPVAGIALRYYLGEGVDSDGASLEVLDGGDVLRTMDASGEAGLNEVVWDFRVDRAFEADGGDGGGFRGGPPPGAGPRVLPGTYTVRLTVGGESQTADVGVRLDPRREAGQAALVARQDAMMRAHALAAPVRDARERIGAMNGRLDEIRALLDEAEVGEGDRERIEAMAEEISGELEEVGDDLGDAAGGTGISQMEGWSGEPTADQVYRIDRAWEALPPVADRINALLTGSMPALEALLGDLGVMPDLGDPIRIPPRS
ncbi:VPS10 domain-containing protein [Candidatus Palauibacter sp.]|uniref:WD40/YVTN/BNR-like repeat-containing protein n=1 Tax=Candidatus Palauibacter sp. TaxID=3101350 RepID=UPI003AF1EC8E